MGGEEDVGYRTEIFNSVFSLRVAAMIGIDRGQLYRSNEGRGFIWLIRWEGCRLIWKSGQGNLALCLCSGQVDETGGRLFVGLLTR